MVGCIFPGQGSQYVGMGKDLYQRSASAKRIFDKADDIIGFSLSRLCFEGPQEALSRTENCQLAILVTSIAAFEALREETEVNANFMAGLSLGEYSALVAAGAVSFEDALLLVKKRAEFMAIAAQKYPGKMLAVIGLDLDTIRQLCKQMQVEIANLNCPGQVVVSGEKKNIDRFSGLVDEKGAKRIVELEVSGAFHSHLMQEASLKLEQELKSIEFKTPQINVISNVSARRFSSPEGIRKNLALQVKSPVLWEDSVGYMTSHGVKKFFEIGPGKVLRGLLRKIDGSLEVINIEKAEDVFNLVKLLNS